MSKLEQPGQRILRYDTKVSKENGNGGSTANKTIELTESIRYIMNKGRKENGSRGYKKRVKVSKKNNDQLSLI